MVEKKYMNMQLEQGTRFLLLIKGKGEGCDYTVGCNMRFKWLPEMRSWDDLDNTLKQIAEDYGFYENGEGWTTDNDRISFFEIIEVPHYVHVDVDKYLEFMIAPEREERARVGREQQEQQERQELARLLEKYGEAG